MKIGLIDVDGHNFPNFALMRLSAWHKAHGDNVEWADPMTDTPEEAFFNWVWQGGYLEELKRSKMALFKLDVKEIINRELGLEL